MDRRLRQVPSRPVVVGHSLGVAFLLHALEQHAVKAAFFVAGFVEPLNDETFDPLNESFLKDFDWNAIRSNCERFFVFHSDNDPYVSLDHAQHLAEKLGVDVTIVENAGHFNEKAGYTEFPALLEKMEDIL